MDWTYPRGAGPEGIFEIGRRLAEHIGRIPDATTFTNDAREMLRITRRVERVARGGRLFVGFQNAHKLELERPRYEALVAADTDIVAFGEGQLREPIAGLEYRALRADRQRLANNWFLVSDAPERVGFVSWEISDADAFGAGGAATPGKEFVGFITDDPLVVTELASVLGTWGRPLRPPPQPTSAADPERPDPASQALIEAISQTSVEATGAAPGAVVLAMRRDDGDGALRTAVAIAAAEERPLVIVDRSAESIFGTPYNDLRGDDEYRPRPDRLFGAATAVREGRALTARAITAATALGVEAGAWFPTRSGADGLAEAVGRFDGSLIVLPGTVRQPSVAERIRGMTLDTLEAIGVPIVVAS
ncbi:MAG: hypothetical protein PVH07_05145 [Chloroflexota bacterium]|jgi:hypothetical protein